MSTMSVCNICMGSGVLYGRTAYVKCPSCGGIGGTPPSLPTFQGLNSLSPDSVKKEAAKPIKPKSKYSFNNLDFKKLLIYSFLGLAGKAVVDRIKKEKNNVREI